MAFNQQTTPHLQLNVPIVDGHGHPTPQFLRLFQQVLDNTGNVAGSAVPASRLINTTSPLQGGGDLSEDLTLSIDGYLTDEAVVMAIQTLVV